MKTNTFDENNLFKVLNKNSVDFKEFKKNPLIELQKGTKVWNFEHRNIQEYFAATCFLIKALSSKAWISFEPFRRISSRSAATCDSVLILPISD